MSFKRSSIGNGRAQFNGRYRWSRGHHEAAQEIITTEGEI